MMGPRTPAFRLRAYYFSVYWAMGCMFTYRAPYFREQCAVSDRELGLLYMVSPAVGLLTQWFWSWLADRYSMRARLASWLCVLAGLSACGFVVARGFLPLLLLIALQAVFFSPLRPIANSVTFSQLGEAGRGRFGNVRVYGTLGFLVALILMGPLWDRIGLVWIFPAFAVGMLLGALLMRTLPAGDPADSERPAVWRAIGQLCGERNVLMFLSASFFASLSGMMAHVFWSIYVKQLGADNTQLGWLWTVGVALEIVVMTKAYRVLERFGVKPLILAGLFAIFLRWTLAALVSSWWQLLPLQLLHAFSFGAFYIGAVSFIDRASPLGIRTSAQAVYAIVASGIARLIGSPLAGEIAERWGYPTLYTVCGALGLVAFGIMLVFVKEPGKEGLPS